MKYGAQIICLVLLIVPHLLFSMDNKNVTVSPMIISDNICKQSMRNYIDRIVREGQSANVSNNGLLKIYIQFKKEIDQKGMLAIDHPTAAVINSLKDIVDKKEVCKALLKDLPVDRQAQEKIIQECNKVIGNAVCDELERTTRLRFTRVHGDILGFLALNKDLSGEKDAQAVRASLFGFFFLQQENSNTLKKMWGE